MIESQIKTQYKPMKLTLLSWLVFHANKSKNKRFYPIKNNILLKHGRKTDTVVQYIEGKKCFSCGATGNYTYYDLNGFEYDYAPCYHCNRTGWYKRPRWNYLEVIQFGKYKFHRPFATVYKEPAENVQQFEGYIEHSNTRHTELALFILFFVYETGFLKRWWNSERHGWRIQWWLPRNWLINAIHILKHGRKAYPLNHKIRFFKRKYKPNYCIDDLPF